MQIPLNEFELHIDETIIKRGLAYFRKGLVQEPEEITSGEFESIVEGTENYTVRLSIKNGVMVDSYCNCPYTDGPVCKHVAAVIFYMQKDVLELETKIIPIHKSGEQPKAKPKPKPKPKLTVEEKLSVLLDKIPHEDLREYINEKAKSDETFRNHFLTSFAHLQSDESIDFYKKQIKTILKNASGRRGYIPWDTAMHLGTTIYEYVDTAQKHFDKGNEKSAMYICCAVMEEMTAALQYADDSHGTISGPVNDAFTILMDLAEYASPDIRKQLFDYAVAAFDKKVFGSWDWHLGMLDLATELAENETDSQILMLLFDKSSFSKYENERAQGIKYEILKKLKGDIAAEKFLEENLSNPAFRHGAIDKALEENNFTRAIALANQGIEQDAKQYPGLVKQWNDCLLKIAQAQNDSVKIIEYARLLFIDNYMPAQDYYEILKTNIPSENWTDFVEEMISDITKNKRWQDRYLLARIYITEQWWAQLLNLVKQQPSLQTLEEYEQYLVKDYKEDLIALYASEIEKYLEYNTGRGYYKTACKYLRRMRKLGAGEKVNSMIETFKTLYKPRRALLEELAKV